MPFGVIFWRLWKLSEALMGGFGRSGRSLGRLGQRLERLNCILDASWERLRGFGRRLEAILRPSSCVLEGLEDVWRAPQQALASSGEGLEPFLRGFLVFFRSFLVFFRSLKPKGKIVKSGGFP